MIYLKLLHILGLPRVLITVLFWQMQHPQQSPLPIHLTLIRLSIVEVVSWEILHAILKATVIANSILCNGYMFLTLFCNSCTLLRSISHSSTFLLISASFDLSVTRSSSVSFSCSAVCDNLCNVSRLTLSLSITLNSKSCFSYTRKAIYNHTLSHFYRCEVRTLSALYMIFIHALTLIKWLRNGTIISSLEHFNTLFNRLHSSLYYNITHSHTCYPLI